MPIPDVYMCDNDRQTIAHQMYDLSVGMMFDDLDFGQRSEFYRRVADWIYLYAKNKDDIVDPNDLKC